MPWHLFFQEVFVTPTVYPQISHSKIIRDSLRLTSPCHCASWEGPWTTVLLCALGLQ